MPVYEYECRVCSERFERFQRFADEPLTTCPECGGQVRRVLHPVGVVFKGSGWYITDNRKSETATVDAASTAGSTKSEKVPAASNGKADDASKTGEAPKAKVGAD